MKISQSSAPKGSWWREAPALRFLALAFVAWAATRAVTPLALLGDAGREHPHIVAENLPPKMKSMAQGKMRAERKAEMASVAENRKEDLLREADAVIHHKPHRTNANILPNRDRIAHKIGGKIFDKFARPEMLPVGISGTDFDAGGGAGAGAGADRSGADGSAAAGAGAWAGGLETGRNEAASPMTMEAAAIAERKASSKPVAAAGETRMALAMLEPATLAVVRRDDGEAVGNMRSARAGWSLSAWALVREKAETQARRPFVGELAGSQLGARIAYGLGESGAMQLYGRGSAALYHRQQSEAAFGASYRPIAKIPLDVAVERRQKIGADGRNAMAAMLVGGVSAKPLPAQFQLNAYVQAGLVGARSQDGFVDGALVVDRDLCSAGKANGFRLGMMVAGAAQPQLSRLDAGPRITLALPKLGQGVWAALDWRSRIAGKAEPSDGPALSLGMDF